MNIMTIYSDNAETITGLEMVESSIIVLDKSLKLASWISSESTTISWKESKVRSGMVPLIEFWLTFSLLTTTRLSLMFSPNTSFTKMPILLWIISTSVAWTQLPASTSKPREQSKVENNWVVRVFCESALIPKKKNNLPQISHLARTNAAPGKTLMPTLKPDMCTLLRTVVPSLVRLRYLWTVTFLS